MSKILGISTYIIFIAFLTFIVSGYARASQTVNFLDAQKEMIYDHPKDLISATLIANTQNQFEIYIQDDALIETLVTEDQYTYQLVIVPVLLYASDQNFQYELIVFIYGYENTDPFAFLEEDALSLIIEIAFESNPEGFSQRVFKENMTQLYDDSMHMFSINQKHFIQEAEEIRIERIEILYPTSFGDVSTLRLIHSQVYQDKGNAFHQEDKDMLSLIQKRNIQLELIEGKTDWYINPHLNQSFASYQYLSFLYIGIEIVILIPITYFIFFHRNIKNIKHKKGAII